jgi:2-dehydro-3-deoxyphosphogluconate aldolase/(4S)-4-hydroxy-2-oxoglutarate aldolase
MLDALAGPYASLRFVPTGGIDASNLANYARKPQVLAVGGSWMVRPEMIAAGDWSSIERLCREAVMALHGFGFAHLGVNSEDEAAARKIVDLFSGLFGFAAKEGASSIMAGESLEIMKSPFLGDKGHLAIRCNDVERALARFGGMGIDSKPETVKMDKGRIKAIYLDMDLGGFAVHLLRT